MKDLRVLSRHSVDKFERNQERLDEKVNSSEGQDITLDELSVENSASLQHYRNPPLPRQRLSKIIGFQS